MNTKNWLWCYSLLSMGLLLPSGGTPSGGLPNAQAQESAASPRVASTDDLPGSQLLARNKEGVSLGACPLEKTQVSTQLGPQMGQTVVRQVFDNPYDVPIEALYTFALPENAAVNGLTLTIGDRKIVGQIQTKARAKQIYDAAKRAGKVAALLDQKRPNSFSQKVANIAPGQKVSVEISYSQTVAWRDGNYEWSFPLATGPRYTPPTAGQTPATFTNGGATNSGTTEEAVTSLPAGSASFDIRINAGLPLQSVESPSHEIKVTGQSGGDARVELQDGSTLPNRDFILHYRTATDQISEALVTHRDGLGTFFSLSLQPPARVASAQTRPKELVWVLDRSGSMDGFPLESAKKLIEKQLDALHSGDTFNLWSFSFGPEAVFDGPVAPTPDNIAIAKRYLETLDSRGPTDMLPVVKAALDAPSDGKRLRIVTFLTDGYVDNDMEIIAAAKAHAKTTRVWSFGVGSAVNRYLLDGLALAGRGESDYVANPKEIDTVADRFIKEVDAPVLTDISLDWGKIPVADVFPRALPDLFAARPLTISGRFTGPANGTLTIRGRTASGSYERKVVISNPKPVQNEAIAALWAKANVADVLSRDLVGLQYDNFNPTLKKQVEKLGLDFELLTPFTSFVAVDSQPNVKAQVPPKKVVVPSAKAAGSAPRGTPYTEESSASRRVGEANYAATESGDFTGAAGDPLLRVEAKDAARVVAIMPDGSVKNLAQITKNGAWEAHFDIPTYAPDGFYQVKVVVIARNGSRRRTELRFSVDNRAPQGIGALRAAAKDWQIAVDCDESIDRAVVLAPWGEKHELRRDGNGWTGAVSVPQSWSGARRVQVILIDHAHNRTVLMLDESR